MAVCEGIAAAPATNLLVLGVDFDPNFAVEDSLAFMDSDTENAVKK